MLAAALDSVPSLVSGELIWPGPQLLPRVRRTDTLATVHYAYDELGRLVGKTVGDGSAPALETNLAYDLHGWSTGINVTVTDGSGIRMNTVFSETLR